MTIELDDLNNPLTVALFEKELSEMLAGCGLTAYGTLQAMAVALARILYGLRQLHGEAGANAGADLFDTVLEMALVKLMDGSTKTPTNPGTATVN